MRPVEFYSPLGFTPCEAVRHVWIRGNPSEQWTSDRRVHQCALSYASDMNLLATALQPHGRTVWMRDMSVASIDHSLWFHKPSFRLDEDWYLYSVESPVTSEGRGFARGQVFTRAGVARAEYCPGRYLQG